MKVEYNVGKSTFCHIHLNLGKRQNLYYFLVFSCWLHDDAAPLLSDSPWSRHLLIMTCESVTWDIWHQLLWHVTIIIAETIIIYCGSVSKSTAAVILIIYMGHRKLHQKLLYQNCWCLQKSYICVWNIEVLREDTNIFYDTAQCNWDKTMNLETPPSCCQLGQRTLTGRKCKYFHKPTSITVNDGGIFLSHTEVLTFAVVKSYLLSLIHHSREEEEECLLG